MEYGMGTLSSIVLEEGVLRLADILLSAVGMAVALWFVVRWRPSASRD